MAYHDLQNKGLLLIQRKSKLIPKLHYRVNQKGLYYTDNKHLAYANLLSTIYNPFIGFLYNYLAQIQTLRYLSYNTS